MFIIDPYRFGTPSVPDPYWANTNLLAHIDTILPTSVVEDFSAYNSDGTLSSATLDTSVFKWNGGSARFSGSGRGIVFGYGTSPFTRFDMNTPSTWEAWVNEDATGSSGVVVSARPAGRARGWMLGTSFINAYVDSVWGSFLTWPAPAYGSWNHIVFQTEGSTGGNAFRIFVNGVQVGYRGFGYIENSLTAPLELQIGSSSSSGENPFKGNIDDIRFTRGVARYPSGGFTPPTGPFANSTP